jgi:hypothetical protein
MSADRDVTRIVRSWLNEDAYEDADRVLSQVLVAIDTTPQRRAGWLARRLPPMNTATRLALAAAAVVLLAFIGLKFLVSGDNIGGPVTSPTPTPTAAPAVGVIGGDGTSVFAGTYRTAFVPAFTLTIDKSVMDPDCPPGIKCHGTANVNQPGWLDLGFGTVHGSELMVVGIAKIHDPSASGTLIDPPADTAAVAAVYAATPGVTVLQAAKPVTVGGLVGTQLDVWAHQGLSLGTRTDVAGSDFGIATEHETRLIILLVNGQTLVITEEIAADNTTHDFQAALTSLQPLIDSIQWQ